MGQVLFPGAGLFELAETAAWMLHQQLTPDQGLLLCKASIAAPCKLGNDQRLLTCLLDTRCNDLCSALVRHAHVNLMRTCETRHGMLQRTI